MFDDNQQPPTHGGAPSNLPIAEPEDVFAAIDPAAIPRAAAAPEETPPPAQVSAPPSALAAGILKPRTEPVTDVMEEHISPPPSPITTPRPAAATAAPVEDILEQNDRPQTSTPLPPLPDTPRYSDDTGDQSYRIQEPRFGRTIVTVVVIFIAVGLLAGGGWWIYTTFVAQPDQDRGIALPEAQTGNTTADVLPPLVQDNEAPAGSENPQPQRSSATPEETEGNILFGTPIDSDGDGLDDAREIEAGTDPFNWDTDGDTLSDFEEIVAWKTDPLNPDSDGDGFADGIEVRNGYNPAGPGKINQPPGASGSDTVSTTGSSTTTSSTSSPSFQ